MDLPYNLHFSLCVLTFLEIFQMFERVYLYVLLTSQDQFLKNNFNITTISWMIFELLLNWVKIIEKFRDLKYLPLQFYGPRPREHFSVSQSSSSVLPPLLSLLPREQLPPCLSYLCPKKKKKNNHRHIHHC